MSKTEKVIFHLPEDSAVDVMEHIAHLGAKVTAEERLRGQSILEETYLRLCKGMNEPKLKADVTVKKRFGDAFLLGTEQFSFVYRFAKRLNKRYGGRDAKVLSS